MADKSNSWNLAIRIAGAGLGAAVAGPLGAALGGWVGSALGESASAIVSKYAEKFGEKAAEKLLETGADSFADKIKGPSPGIENAYREALKRSLGEIQSSGRLDAYSDWFKNWQRSLSGAELLKLSQVTLAELAPDKIDDLFRETLERLDAQGAAISKGDLSLIPKSRKMPDDLLSELTTKLPRYFQFDFATVITEEKYEGAWKELQLIFQQFTDTTLRRIAGDTAAIRHQLSALLTQKSVAQAATIKKTVWRDLSHLFVPFRGEVSEQSVGYLRSELFFGLASTFRGLPYCQFTSLLRYAEREAKGETVPMFYLLSQEIEFCESVRKTAEQFIRTYYAAKSDLKLYEKLAREQQELTDSFNREWNADASFGVSSDWIPLEFTVDSAKKSITIYELPMSLNPLDYPSGITSTSEMLRFIASYTNAPGIMFFGDVVWYRDNYSLMKLWRDFIDNNRVELKRVRVNASDYEEWDYVNTAVDLEIKNLKK